MRSSLFCDVTRRRSDYLTVEDGADGLCRHVGNYQPTPRNIPVRRAETSTYSVNLIHYLLMYGSLLLYYRPQTNIKSMCRSCTIQRGNGTALNAGVSVTGPCPQYRRPLTVTPRQHNVSIQLNCHPTTSPPKSLTLPSPGQSTCSQIHVTTARFCDCDCLLFTSHGRISASPLILQH
jgi:hypothetical protein